MKILVIAVVVLCLASVAVAKRPESGRLSPPDLVPHEHYFEQPDRDPTDPKAGRLVDMFDIMFGPEEDGPFEKHKNATFRRDWVIRPLLLGSRGRPVHRPKPSRSTSRRVKK